MNARLDWETAYTVSGDDSIHYAWKRSLLVAWRLVGWALQQPDEHLVPRFLGDLDLLDTDTVDLVVAALGLAVLEQAWRCDTRPDADGVLLTGIAEQLGSLVSHRQATPLSDPGDPDDLWPLLSTADQAQLDNAADLARLVLSAHTAHTTGPRPVSVAERLRHCPRTYSPAMLFHADTRRQLDLFITPRPRGRRIQTDGEFRLDDGILRCPHCGATRRLQLSCQDAGTDVTAACPDGHTWPVPQVTPGDLERIIEEEAQRRSDGTDG